MAYIETLNSFNIAPKDAVRAFATVADMQAATDLDAGVTCHTNGFHEDGDGGAAYYAISTEGNADGVNIIPCGNLYARAIADYGEKLDEYYATYTYPNLINWGELHEAPMARPFNSSGIDVIAHWYNDFGLQSTALAPNQANGSYAWYDWRWNFPINATNPPVAGYTYDASREPLFGYYPGDDAKVLDWICYWLLEAGVNVVYLEQSFSDVENWSNPTSKDYWKYALFNNVKNFKSLRYVVNMFGGTADQAKCDAACENALAVIAEHDNLYTYRVNGKRYCVLGIWDGQMLRGAYDNYSGVTNTVAKLNSVADTMIAAGYDGVIYLTRNLGTSSFAAYSGFDTANEKFIMLDCQYSGVYQDQTTDFNDSYAEYVENVEFPSSTYVVPNICTSRKTQAPHPSTFSLAGSTPELFQKLVQRVRNHIDKSGCPRMLTVYNVSEWAEGGPGLIPNLRDGFGYLDALRSGLVYSGSHNDLTALESQIPELAIANRKHFYRAYVKRTITQADASIEIPLSGLYDYHDSADDYVSFASIEAPAGNHYTYTTGLNFGTKRAYVHVHNESYTESHDIKISFMLIYGAAHS